MNRIGLAIVWLGILIILTGCTKYDVKEGTQPPVRVRDANFQGTQIRWNNVSLLDRSIKHKIFVDATNSMRTPTGTLKVWAILRNRTNFPLQVEARVAFYDATKAPLEGPTSWDRIHLPPNATAHYEESSTKTEIGYYHIEVREGR